MRAGRLRNKLEFLEKFETFDQYGRAETSWSVFATCWGEITQISGRESWANDRVLNDLSIAFRIRFRPGLTNDMRVRYDGVDYELVEKVDPNGKRAELVIALRATV